MTYIDSLIYEKENLDKFLNAILPFMILYV